MLQIEESLDVELARTSSRNPSAMPEDRPLFDVVDGHVRLSPDIHPFSDLLERSADDVLEAFRRSQAEDFMAMAAEAERPSSPLFKIFAALRSRLPPDNSFHHAALFRPGALGLLFTELHQHVMTHPVWRHPFFLRFFEGDFSRDQAVTFAVHYFNQIKNTRQCVALAVGRFHGLAAMPHGHLNERISELTQIVLAQLVADEYGVRGHDAAEGPGLAGVLESRTHIGLYRQLLEGLGVPLDSQDVPMLPGVADNVLTQRMLAGDPCFTSLEALASVGLGMEWGVPEFFSLLLGGLVRFALKNGVVLTPWHLQVFSEHVRLDVAHAISVMLVTSLHMHSQDDLSAVKGACNALMASRYAMMTDLYARVFEEPCASLGEMGLDPRYHLTDGRAAAALRAARRAIDPTHVVGGPSFQERPVPFLCAK